MQPIHEMGAARRQRADRWHAVCFQQGNVTRILVVDDSALIRKLLERLLAEQGLEATTFARVDGAAAIDTKSFGAAILDVEIEDQSGIELGRSLLERDPSLPVSFLTGTTDPNLIREARALGPVFEKGEDLTPAATWAGVTARR